MKKYSSESLRKLADAAFRQAAKKVIERAEAAGTRIIVWEDGSLKKLKPEEFRKRKRAKTSRRRTG